MTDEMRHTLRLSYIGALIATMQAQNKLHLPFNWALADHIERLFEYVKVSP